MLFSLQHCLCASLLELWHFFSSIIPSAILAETFCKNGASCRPTSTGGRKQISASFLIQLYTHLVRKSRFHRYITPWFIIKNSGPLRVNHPVHYYHQQIVRYHMRDGRNINEVRCVQTVACNDFRISCWYTVNFDPALMPIQCVCSRCLHFESGSCIYYEIRSEIGGNMYPRNIAHIHTMSGPKFWINVNKKVYMQSAVWEH